MPLRVMTCAAVVLAAVAACAGSGMPSSGPSSTPSSTPTLSITSTSAPQPTSLAPAVGPPAGRLAAEGGDPVTGQLGTYVWRDTGSDSPWLPGAPIAVGAGEPLTVTFDQPIEVASWRARLVPADADGPDGAALLGQGTGGLTFQAPGPGSWTVEVHVVFGAGDASYFWRLDVR